MIEDSVAHSGLGAKQEEPGISIAEYARLNGVSRAARSISTSIRATSLAQPRTGATGNTARGPLPEGQNPGGCALHPLQGVRKVDLGAPR